MIVPLCGLVRKFRWRRLLGAEVFPIASPYGGRQHGRASGLGETSGALNRPNPCRVGRICEIGHFQPSVTSSASIHYPSFWIGSALPPWALATCEMHESALKKLLSQRYHWDRGSTPIAKSTYLRHQLWATAHSHRGENEILSCRFWMRSSTITARRTGSSRSAGCCRSPRRPITPMSWTGSTIAGCWSPSATSHQPKPRSATTLCWKSQPWPRDSNEPAAGNPGAVQPVPFYRH